VEHLAARLGRDDRIERSTEKLVMRAIVAVCAVALLVGAFSILYPAKDDDEAKRNCEMAAQARDSARIRAGIVAEHPTWTSSEVESALGGNYVSILAAARSECAARSTAK
jgi:hypothetical protein